MRGTVAKRLRREAKAGPWDGKTSYNLEQEKRNVKGPDGEYHTITIPKTLQLRPICVRGQYQRAKKLYKRNPA